MSDENSVGSDTPTNIETWIDEKFTAPGLADKFELDGETYVCTDVTWDREDDEVHATYRNINKQAPVRTPAAILTYYDTESLPQNHPTKQKPSAGAAGAPVVNLNPVHPSQQGHYFNNPADDIVPMRRRPIKDNPQA